VAAHTLRILTFNCLYHGAARQRLDAIGPLLNASSLDIVCLQEVTRQRNVRLLESHLRTYQPAAFKPYSVAVAGGLVTFSRHRIQRTSYEVFRGRGPHWTLAWADRLLRKGFLTSWLQFEALSLVVINTHLVANYDEDWSPGNRFVREQRSDLEQLALAIDRLDRESLVVVAGDFNVPAENPMLVEFMARCGLRDTFSPAGGQRAPTFRQTRPDRPVQALDHVLYRPIPGAHAQVTARLRFEEPVAVAGRGLAFASDHLAVEAEIAI
jgi:endonuclease/exonuclease/phosphatase family metal-dependent hydrolase